MDEVKQYNNRQRSIYLDIVKGITVFLMIWGHCIQYCSNGEFDFFENSVFKFIYSFHMPLFMLVSGYLFAFSCKKRKLHELLIHRTQALLQPIIMCTIFIYFLSDAIVGIRIGAIIDAPWLTHFRSLWFLWSVLAASVVLCVLEKATSNCFLKILIGFSGFIFVCLFPNWELNLYMYPFFLIGFLYAKYKEKIPKLALKCRYLFLIIFPVMFCFYKKKHFIYTTGILSSKDIVELLSIDTFRWAIGLSGSIFVLVIIELLFKLDFSKAQIFLKSFSCLGIKSLQIYCMSVLFVSFWLPRIFEDICKYLGGNLFAESMIVYNCLFTPILAILFSILIYLFIKLLDKIKISKVLFGR